MRENYDLPLMAGGRECDSSYDCHDGAMMLYWNCADESMFISYALELNTLGFSKHQELDNISVHSLTCYKDGLVIHTYYLKKTEELRVIIHKDAVLPVNPYKYKKLCDVAVTQLGTYQDEVTYVGMGYLIRLEDGTFVVIDGGQTPEYDSKLLYDTMLEQKPEGVDNIVISAWIITHGHGDHCGVLQYFMRERSEDITVRMMIGNDAPDNIYATCVDGFKRGFEFDSVNGKFGGCVYMKAHTGQQFFFPGISFTVLYTHEDFYPLNMVGYNDVSVVIDATVKGEVARSPLKSGETRFVWLSDVGQQCLIKMYGEEMECDVMQIAHHGIGGGWYELYQLCKPRIAYWPCGRTVLEYKDGIRFTRPYIKFLMDTVEQMIYRADGTHTFFFGKEKNNLS